jgi:phosphoribosylaminoimidazole (AIR) synthetase
MVAVVPRAGVATAIASLSEAGFAAWEVGDVVAIEAGEARYSES